MLWAQYPPPAGQFGSTAINADSNIIIDWASECNVERGFIDISQPELGYVYYGNDTSGVGKADISVVSLGDGGIAELKFSTPISDGEGWDFVVFENSFLDDFLELAFVEVSSNGIDFYRFNSTSLTQYETQVTTFGTLDATKINNLAGKYKAMHGVPFDLSELQDITGLELSNIISIRIIDVVGSVDSNYGSFDSAGSIINDPWPTPFETGGFDLDAIGVINNRDNTSITEITKNISGIIFPNPANKHFNISLDEKINNVVISDVAGNIVSEDIAPNKNNIVIDFLPPGFYIVKIFSKENLYTTKLIVR